MIIKNYVYDRKSISGGRVEIYENARDVVVHLGAFTGESYVGPEVGNGPLSPTTHLYPSEAHEGDFYHFIDFTDNDGVRCRLRVTAYAYVCNDQGKTIEKVGGLNANAPVSEPRSA